MNPALRLLLGLIFPLLVSGAQNSSVEPKSADASGWRYEELRRFKAPEARQGVAVDREFFYAIDNYTVAKYRKTDGVRVAIWEGARGGPIIHLNAGVVYDGRLYCAHSNFPAVPMLSSIEIFDADTLRHIGSHSFGRTDGSLTWVVRRQGDSADSAGLGTGVSGAARTAVPLRPDSDARWVACFVHYGRRGGEPGRGPEWTHLVEFDGGWRRLRGWALPAALVAHVGAHGYSLSGGAFGPRGLLYATGHDEPELYVLDFPAAGSTLAWIATIPITAEGQAFCWDPEHPDVLYTILRKTREVVVGRVSAP